MSAAEVLDGQIEAFVSQWAGKADQRGAAWYALMDETIGGSELAALTGANKYKTRGEVLVDKYNARMAQMRLTRGRQPKFVPGAKKGGAAGNAAFTNLACSMGTVFEDPVVRYLELELGTTMRGTEICVSVVPGHRFSPDGICVVRRRDDGTIWRRSDYDSAAVAATTFVAATPEIALIEVKCPLRRAPCGVVPPQYVPQVLSGLSVIEIAKTGIFTDVKVARMTFGEFEQVLRGEPRVTYGVSVLFAAQTPQVTADQMAAKAALRQALEARTGEYNEERERAVELAAAACVAAGTHVIHGATAADAGTLVDLAELAAEGQAYVQALRDVYRAPACAALGAERVLDLGGEDRALEYALAGTITGDNVAPPLRVVHSDPVLNATQPTVLDLVAMTRQVIDAHADSIPVAVLAWQFSQVELLEVAPRPGYLESVVKPVVREFWNDVRSALAAPVFSAWLAEYRSRTEKVRTTKGGRPKKPPAPAATQGDIDDIIAAMESAS